MTIEMNRWNFPQKEMSRQTQQPPVIKTLLEVDEGVLLSTASCRLVVDGSRDSRRPRIIEKFSQEFLD